MEVYLFLEAPYCDFGDAYMCHYWGSCFNICTCIVRNINCDLLSRNSELYIARSYYSGSGVICSIYCKGKHYKWGPFVFVSVFIPAITFEQNGW